MSGHLVTEYVSLTTTILVPKEWPVYGLEKFLVPLIEKVIDTVNSGKSSVLQLINVPAKLVQRRDKSGTKYFFKKVSAEEVTSSYIFDVIFDKDDKNIQALKNATRDARQQRIPLENYFIHMLQSDFGTVYYMLFTTKTMQTSIVIKSLQHEQRQRNMLSERKMICKVMFLLAVAGVILLLYITFLVEAYFNH